MAKSTVAAVVKNRVMGSASSAYTAPFSRPRKTYSIIGPPPQGSALVGTELAAADGGQHQRVGTPAVVVVLGEAALAHRQGVEAAKRLERVAHHLTGHGARDLPQRRHARHVAVGCADFAPPL